MRLELSSYIQQSLKRHQEIDRKLQPLLKVIKDSKIHSIHQISTDYEISENCSILNTIKDLPSRHESFKKYYSDNERTSPAKPRTSISNYSPRHCNKYNSGCNNEERTEEAIAYRNPNSKIKKHLIETMRFQSLESSTVKPRSSRFQDFIDTLVHKQRTSQSERKRNTTSHIIQRVRLIDNEQAIEIFENCPKTNDDSLFKVKLRKRFWRRESNVKKVSNLRNVLCVKGMKQMAITIDA